MSRPILDYGSMMSPRLPRAGSGVEPDRLAGALSAGFRGAHATVQARRATGEIGFFDLPDDRAAAGRVTEVAASLGAGLRDVVVLGIGGSGLGATTLRDVLCGLRWNQDEAARAGRPRLHVLDNPDPETVTGLLGALDPSTTLFNVISKSGSTAETMSLYLVARAWVTDALGEATIPERFVFTTDPKTGVLRRIADREGITTLDVPPNVGGRFSVLTAVGLLPAALMGCDIDALLQGALKMREACSGDDLASNPAGLFASLLHDADTRQGRAIHVLMPYADRLRSLTLWFQQLWAESLGKVRDGQHVGPTPLPAVGATDQHAQVQLFMEGPHDKVVVFLATPVAGDPVMIPALHPDENALSYLGGSSLGELLDLERQATAEALRQGGRPSMTLELAAVDARTLGALIMFFEVATVFAGALYGVDPLNQPGVELGKTLTYGLMGREGFPVPEIDSSGGEWRS